MSNVHVKQEQTFNTVRFKPERMLFNVQRYSSLGVIFGNRALESDGNATRRDVRPVPSLTASLSSISLFFPAKEKMAFRPSLPFPPLIRSLSRSKTPCYCFLLFPPFFSEEVGRPFGRVWTLLPISPPSPPPLFSSNLYNMTC